MGEQESALDPDPQGFMSSFRLFYSTGQVSSPLRFSFESRCAKNNALCVDMLYGYVKIVPGPPAGTWPAMRAIIYDKKAPSAFQTTWMLMQGAGLPHRGLSMHGAVWREGRGLRVSQALQKSFLEDTV